MATPSKNTLIEVVVAAVATTSLRDVGLDALKGVLSSDPRLAILDGAFDLQPVWEVISHQPGFDVEVVGPPLCYVKTLEERLGVEVRLPQALADLSPTEVRLRASRCNPPREQIDRILRPIELARSREVRRVPAAPRIRLPRKRLYLLIAATVVFLASGIYLAVFLAGSVQQTPRWKNVDPSEFAGDIPILSARLWASEVHAVLADALWFRQTEAVRRRQLEQALERLSPRKVKVLILVDEGQRQRASAQLFGNPPRVQARFY